MNFTVKKYPHGTFSWADIYTKDMPATKAFFSDLFGWTAEDQPDVDYTMFYLDGQAVAGGSGMSMQERPPSWSCYISVDNVDDVLSQVASLGGKVVMEAMDVMSAGRMAAILDPTGAVVMLWQPKDHIGAGVVNKVGAMGWNDLITTDVEAAKKFYGDLLGWTFDFDEKNDYTVIKNNGRMNGGVMKLTAEMGDMPPYWGVYFSVENIDKTVEIVNENGGAVYKAPFEVSGLGKMAVVAGPSGAVFTAIELAAAPDEWPE